MSDEERFMRTALGEARKSFGQTSPNPAVGAILVSRDRLLARGRHRQAGKPHAEVECLRTAPRKLPKDAILYVTLEPCSTTGRTGPCTEEIIRSGIRSVVIGASDPNPRHRGAGIEILQKAGIDVRAGVLAEECAAMNEAFNKWIATGIPFVIAKCAMSLDGRLTRRKNEPRWLTSSVARKHAHKLRAQVDAILVGAETIRIDNPRLTVRAGPRPQRQPARVVLTHSSRLPRNARVLTDRFAKSTQVYRSKPLATVLADLGAKNVTSVLIEGGGKVLGQALDERLIDKVQIYVAPIFSGGPVISFAGQGVSQTIAAAHLERITFEKLGNEICVTGYPKYAIAGSA
jgi:diaminohydroxyphosphoribosylaminopyrimidine deaminase / 5-amino-6-(5-phosphoribosylamino)uracil reductase